MTTAIRTRTIAAAPAAIWEVLADFGALSRWAEGVDHSCLLRDGADPIGMARRVQVGRDTLVETIVSFDPGRELAYDISGLPGWISVSNRWNLRADTAGRTTVTLTGTVRTRPAPLRAIGERVITRLMAKRADDLLNSLADYLNGRPGQPGNHPDTTMERTR